MSIFGAIENVSAAYAENAKISNTDSKDFDKLAAWVEGQRAIEDMSGEIVKTFHAQVYIVDYTGKHADDDGLNYTSSLVEGGNFRGDGNIVISKKTLLKMSRDGRFKERVFKSIRDGADLKGIKGKSSGAVILEDGTACYWVEFEREDSKLKKVIVDRQPLMDLSQINGIRDVDPPEPDYIAGMQAQLSVDRGSRRKEYKDEF